MANQLIRRGRESAIVSIRSCFLEIRVSNFMTVLGATSELKFSPKQKLVNSYVDGFIGVGVWGRETATAERRKMNAVDAIDVGDFGGLRALHSFREIGMSGRCSKRATTWVACGIATAIPERDAMSKASDSRRNLRKVVADGYSGFTLTRANVDAA